MIALNYPATWDFQNLPNYAGETLGVVAMMNSVTVVPPS